jgi:hypothetical protein
MDKTCSILNCSTPQDRVSRISPRVAPYETVLLCEAHFLARMEHDEQIQTGVCRTCGEELYGGASHPQCDGFPLD